MSEDAFWSLTINEFLALQERQRLATERTFFPFACLLAQHRNLAFGVKHDRQYSPEDFMPKQRPRHQSLKPGPLPASVFWQFKKAQQGGR